MPRINLPLLITVSLLIAPAPSFAGGDPCDFASGGPLYPYTQVLACYESVPFNPADLQNTVDAISAYRERSSLREIYEQQVGWRASLQTLGAQTFPNDHAMHMALMLNHKEFDNAHFRYRRPSCYGRILTAFQPFDFGSTQINGLGQIVFVEATPHLAAEYQAATGIDTTALVGQRVVSINGVEALEYFRQFGSTYIRYDSNDGLNLSAVLTRSGYTLRLTPRHDLVPFNAVDTYVFADTDGITTTIDIPWMFAPRTLFSDGDALTSSTTEFVAACTVPGPNTAARAQETFEPARPERFGDADIREKSQVVRKQMKQAPQRGAANQFYEVPPEQLGQFVDVIMPWTNGGTALALPGDNATVIRIADFVGDWQVPVRAATEHACANSDYLIVDLRSNGGGLPLHQVWLTRHLLPDAISRPENDSLASYLNVTAHQELALRSSITATDQFGEFACWFAYEAGCYVDSATEAQMSNLVDQDWILDLLRFEDRAGVAEPLTRQFWLHESFSTFTFDFTGYDPIACPGTFEDDKLIVLTNGLSFSAAYFFTEVIRERLTVVTAGGYVGEPLVSGSARGGGIFSYQGVSSLELYLAGIHGPATDPLPILSRDVDVFAEMAGALYMPNGVDLHVYNVPFGDIQIPVWSDSPETDGFVYRAALAAVKAAFDVDGDGINNTSDNCTNVPNPAQRDTDNDGFGNFCDADFNNSGFVDFPDLGIMKAGFFGSDPDLDLNGDGMVNFTDLTIMKSGFFQPPGPAG